MTEEGKDLVFKLVLLGLCIGIFLGAILFFSGPPIEDVTGYLEQEFPPSW